MARERPDVVCTACDGFGLPHALQGQQGVRRWGGPATASARRRRLCARQHEKNEVEHELIDTSGGDAIGRSVLGRSSRRSTRRVRRLRWKRECDLLGPVHGVAALGRHPVPRVPEVLRVSLLQIHAPRVVLWLDEQVTPQPLAL